MSKAWPGADSTRWSHPVPHFGTRGMPYLRWGGLTQKWCEDLALSISKVDALPSTKASIDRPSARSEQRQGGTEGSQHDTTPRISRLREGVPQRDDHHKCSRDRRT